VHFLCDMGGHVALAQQPVVATAIRQVFAAENGTESRERLRDVVARLDGSAAKVARLLEGADDDLRGHQRAGRSEYRPLLAERAVRVRVRRRGADPA
jgi:hypothetical protein